MRIRPVQRMPGHTRQSQASPSRRDLLIKEITAGEKHSRTHASNPNLGYLGTRLILIRQNATPTDSWTRIQGLPIDGQIRLV